MLAMSVRGEGPGGNEGAHGRKAPDNEAAKATAAAGATKARQGV